MLNSNQLKKIDAMKKVLDSDMDFLSQMEEIKKIAGIETPIVKKEPKESKKVGDLFEGSDKVVNEFFGNWI